MSNSGHPARQRLENRRASQTLAFEAGGLPYIASYSRFDDGRIAEVFISTHRAGSTAGILASDSAIAASLALQFGCPAEVLRKALSRDGRGVASSPLGAAMDLITGSGGSTR